MHFVGVDLAWGDRQPTGLAVLDEDARLVHISTVRTDEEIRTALTPYVEGPCLVGIDAPLIANRRVTAHARTLSGIPLPDEAKVSVLWASANRDERVFGDPDEFRLDRDPASNLLYGAGIHVCPGAPLARLELQSFVTALLDGADRIRPVSEPMPVRASYPAGGYRSAGVALDDPG